MIVLESAEWFKFTTQYFILDKAKTLPVRIIIIDGFHSDIIRLQSQKSKVLRILIYTRLKINRK